VLTEVGVAMRPAADRKDEVVTVGVAGEAPVLSVAGVSSALEAKRQHSGVVAERRVHDVVRRVSHWLQVPIACPTTDSQRSCIKVSLLRSGAKHASWKQVNQLRAIK